MRIRTVLLPCILACLLLSSCSVQNTESVPSEQETYLFTAYFLNANDNLVPLQAKSDIPFTPESALNYITNKADMFSEQLTKRGLYFPINTEMKAEFFSVGKKVTVDLQGLQAKNKIQERAKLLCISNTLLGLDTVDEVQFTFSGKKIQKLPFGTIVGVPYAQIEFTAEKEQVCKTASAMNLYFVDADGRQLTPTTRYITEKLTLKTLMEEFIKGPIGGFHLMNALPQGVVLLSAEQEGEVATINFSRELENIMENPELEKILQQAIVTNCRNLQGIRKVMILIEGKEYYSCNING